jgi:beta-N-acetylhexosaminidase
VKHFPGHGDTASNSHVDLPDLAANRDRLNSVEFKPFEAAIAHHVDSVMIAHMTVPALDSEGLPATLSPAVLGTLRQDLKFDDLIVTDAMDMAGVLKQFPAAEGAVRAIAAGEDILLMPPDPERAIRAVVAAVNSGRIPRSRIEQSATRLIAAKMRVGLMKKKLTDIDAVSDALDVPETNQRVQKISDQAVTLIKNDNKLLPLDRTSRPCVIVMREVRVSTTGLRMAQEIQSRAPGTRLIVVDSSLPLAALQATVGDTNSCSAMIVETSITGSDSRTSMTLAGDLGPFVQHLTEGSVPVVLVSLGSPYVIAAFPKSAAYLATLSPTVPSEVSAAKALFGEIAIQGHIPVTIPGFAALNDGIQIPARSR